MAHRAVIARSLAATAFKGSGQQVIGSAGVLGAQ